MTPFDSSGITVADAIEAVRGPWSEIAMFRRAASDGLWTHEQRYQLRMIRNADPTIARVLRLPAHPERRECRTQGFTKAQRNVLGWFDWTLSRIEVRELWDYVYFGNPDQVDCFSAIWKMVMLKQENPQDPAIEEIFAKNQSVWNRLGDQEKAEVKLFESILYFCCD